MRLRSEGLSGSWNTTAPPGLRTRTNSTIQLRISFSPLKCWRTIKLDTKSKLSSGKGSVHEWLTTNSQLENCLLNSCARKTISQETSIPTQLENLEANARVSLP